MQSSATPTLTPIAFATNGTKNTIPEASQISVTPGAASFNDGFPPLTMTAVAAGGIPPSGADMNGALFALSSAIRWQQAGGRYAYNSAFATDSNVGGYPSGARVLRSDLLGTWQSTSDNNQTDPEGSSAAGWVPVGDTYGSVALALTTGTVTLTPLQYGYQTIALSGTLTGNVTIVMPAIVAQWRIINGATLGTYTVTVKTASGTGVVLVAGLQHIAGDGANVISNLDVRYAPVNGSTSNRFSVAPAVAATDVPQASQVPLSIGGSPKMSAVAASAATTISFTDESLVVASALTGATQRIANFSATLNLATTGAGGMDTGTATANGWLAVYGAWNPTTLASTVFGTMLYTSTVAPSIYGGTSAPSGYTMTALIGYFRVGATAGALNGIRIRGRRHLIPQTASLNGAAVSTTPVSASLSSIVPPGALRIAGAFGFTNGTASNMVLILSGDSSSFLGQKYKSTSIATTEVDPFDFVELGTSQTMWYTFTSSAGSAYCYAYISEYEI